MCIAILNKTAVLTREALHNCWEANSHGAGILFTDGQQLVRQTELNDFGAFYALYAAARARTALPMLIHFRISTSGKVNDDNCHPFFVPGTDWGLVHNGMLDVVSNKEYSDTWHFANKYATQFRDLRNPWARLMLEEMAGKYNKLLFLNAAGDFFIINEAAGHWDKAGDTWYSNHSYCETGFGYYGNTRFKLGTTPGVRYLSSGWDDDHYDDGYEERRFNSALAEQDDTPAHEPYHPDGEGGLLEREYLRYAAVPAGERLAFKDAKLEESYRRWAGLRDAWTMKDIGNFRQLWKKHMDFPHWMSQDFAAKANAWCEKHADLDLFGEGKKKDRPRRAGRHKYRKHRHSTSRW